MPLQSKQRGLVLASAHPGTNQHVVIEKQVPDLQGGLLVLTRHHAFVNQLPLPVRLKVLVVQNSIELQVMCQDCETSPWRESIAVQVSKKLSQFQTQS